MAVANKGEGMNIPVTSGKPEPEDDENLPDDPLDYVMDRLNSVINEAVVITNSENELLSEEVEWERLRTLSIMSMAVDVRRIFQVMAKDITLKQAHMQAAGMIRFSPGREDVN
jgi:hypothetical protein